MIFVEGFSLKWYKFAGLEELKEANSIGIWLFHFLTVPCETSFPFNILNIILMTDQTLWISQVSKQNTI